MKQQRAIIIGAGVAGLAAALRLGEGQRLAPLLLEREEPLRLEVGPARESLLHRILPDEPHEPVRHLIHVGRHDGVARLRLDSHDLEKFVRVHHGVPLIDEKTGFRIRDSRLLLVEVDDRTSPRRRERLDLRELLVLSLEVLLIGLREFAVKNDEHELLHRLIDDLLPTPGEALPFGVELELGLPEGSYPPESRKQVEPRGHRKVRHRARTPPFKAVGERVQLLPV